MRNFISVLKESRKGWQLTAGLTFKKALPTVLVVTLIIFAAQIAGVCISLYFAAELNWQNTVTDNITGTQITQLWGPRLEGLMYKGAWFPLSAAGYLFVLLTVAMTPVRMAGGNKLLHTIGRMPMGGRAPRIGSVLSGLSFSLFYWAMELMNFFTAALFYEKFVPEAAQLPHPMMMALLRWEALNGLFPVARPWMLILMAVTGLSQVIAVSCIGWHLAEGRERAAVHIFVLAVILIFSVFQYKTGLGNTAVFCVSLTAAVSLWGNLIRRQFRGEEEP